SNADGNSLGIVTMEAFVTGNAVVDGVIGLAVGDDGNVWFAQGNNHIASMGTVPVSQGEFTPLAPVRILDTRSGLGGHPGPLVDDEVYSVQITGHGGVPASQVSAVSLNVTVTEPTAPGYLTLWPTGAGRPLISNLNFVPGETIPNAVIVGVGT